MGPAPRSRIGPYEILSRLGSGGMGDVFLARDTRLQRQVAVKLIRAPDPDERRDLDRSLQEARAAARVLHPNIVVVYDVGEDTGMPFIAMEYVHGQPLAERLRGAALSEPEIVRIAIEIANGLQAAHTAGIVHRDVKPANVMITPSGSVKVVDFGLARIATVDTAAADAGTSLTTHPGTLAGTVAYMSPEQTLGGPIDPRSDLFSLGVVLYEAATRRLPFAAPTGVETLERIRHTEPDAIGGFNSAISQEFERIIRKCLAKRPDDRYQTASQLLRDLQELLPAAAFERPARRPHRRDPHNLPADVTTFIGRTEEVEHTAALVESTRLLSLTGAGGCGKTRLAQQIGIRVADTFDDGVWFVDLAPVSDPGLLASVVARTLDVPERAGAPPIDALTDWLRSRHVLVILDNCEHMIDQCAALAETLLRNAPLTRIVATSREALSVPGETVWRVPSLGLPPANEVDPARLLEFDAVRLFVERAASAGHAVSTSEEIKAATDVCRRLDGIALAIELAAARVRVLSIEQIRDRLHDRFRLLSGGRTVIARQRTLEATVDWSYELLTDPERVLLARLSVFSGGCELEAAERVCSGGDIETRDVLDLLSRLVDKSLVMVDEGKGSGRRYRLLETIRQYGRERLLRSGETAALSNRHFAYFLALARRAEPELIGRDQVNWLERLDEDHDNFRTAMDWGVDEPSRHVEALELAKCFAWFWIKRGYFSEGRRRLESILAVSGDVPGQLEARALMSLAHLASFEGDLQTTREATAKSLAKARAVGDDWTEAFALGYQAIIESDAGDFSASAALAVAARDIAVTCKDRATHQPLSLSLRMLAYNAMQESDLHKAGALFEQAIAESRRGADLWALGILLSDLAALRVLESRHAEAASLAKEALAFCRALEDRRGMGWCLQTIAMVEAAAQRPQAAATIYAAAEALLKSVGATSQMTVTRMQDRFLHAARQEIGEEAFANAAAAGRVLPVQSIMDLALRSNS